MARMRRLFCGFVWCCFLGVLLCCSKDDPAEQEQPTSERRAPLAASDSFLVFEGTSGSPRVAIKKQSLNKEFLFHGTSIGQDYVATGTSMKTRVVVFRQHHGKLYLLESVQGHSINEHLPQAFVLSSFPILEDTEEHIAFDFNEGMKVAFFNSELWTSTVNRLYRTTFSNTRLAQSYLQEATIEHNHLVVRQIGQLEIDPVLDPPPEAMWEFRYYLTPYHPDPSFVHSQPGNEINVSYLMAAPQLNGRGLVNKSAKFHLSHPIVFAVSANTPEAYKQAVRDGALYWNQAFSTDPIQVIDAPEGVTAPHPKYNVLQWVESESVRRAYADLQLDPRTGQVLHAQAFLSSYFAIDGVRSARRILQQLRTASPRSFGRPGDLSVPPQPVHFFSRQGQREHSLCQLSHTAGAIGSYVSLLSSLVASQRIPAISQDYVRWMVAHEVGHLLGLRHNFAGSLGTQNYELRNKRSLFEAYARDGSVPGNLQVSSAVMDYLPVEEAAIVGRQIALRRGALPHDRIAIAHLYEGESIEGRSDLPLFCTDENHPAFGGRTVRFADCHVFDSGQSLIEHAAEATKEKLQSLAYQIVEAFVAKKSPALGHAPTPVRRVGFDLEELAKAIFEARSTLVSSFGSMWAQYQFLRPYRSLPSVSTIDLARFREIEGEYIHRELQRVGGIASVFVGVRADYFRETRESIARALRSEQYRSGIAPSGEQYEFSDAEVNQVDAITTRMMARFPEFLTKEDLRILRQIPRVWKRPSPVGDGLAAVLIERAREYVLRRVGRTEIIEGQIKIPASASSVAAERARARTDSSLKVQKRVRLPRFLYKLVMRKKAAELLNAPNEPESVGWGYAERQTLKREFLRLVDTACNCQFKDIDPDAIEILETDRTRRLQITQWFIGNEQVYDNLK